jgi:hypothetical protein
MVYERPSPRYCWGLDRTTAHQLTATFKTTTSSDCCHPEAAITSGVLDPQMKNNKTTVLNFHGARFVIVADSTQYATLRAHAWERSVSWRRLLKWYQRRHRRSDATPGDTHSAAVKEPKADVGRTIAVRTQCWRLSRKTFGSCSSRKEYYAARAASVEATEQ